MTTRAAAPITTAMKTNWAGVLALAFLCNSVVSGGAAPEAGQVNKTVSKPAIRGLHLSAPGKRDLGAALDFIRELLPKEGVNNTR